MKQYLAADDSFIRRNVMQEAFVYDLIDDVTHKHYIGVHKGTLDDGYVCSSKHVLKEYHKRPETFSRMILATGSKEEMFELEAFLLQKIDAKNNESFYNLHNGDGKFVWKGTFEKGHTPWNKGLDISDSRIAAKSKKQAQSLKKAYRTGRITHPNRGKTKENTPWVAESAMKRSELLLGRKNPEHSKFMRESYLNGKSSFKTLNNTTIKCPICDTEGGANVMKRWHFNNCKKRESR